MDYAIFLLHKFADFREEGMDIKEAMANAMKKSYTSILSSGLTTILGFLALALMRFKIGPDLGIVLAKGIVFSLLSVMFLLPVLTMYTYRIIDKTHHRSFIPKFDKFSKFALKIGPFIVIFVLIVIGPAYLAQGKNQFSYGASSMSSGEETIVGRDTKKIDDVYGKSNQLVLLVPSSNPVAEKAIGEDINNVEGVSDIISYSITVGNEIPKEFIPEDTISSLVSQNYSRMIITLDAEEESDIAFNAIKSIRSLGQK
jgi:predicted RND superfamily exporter protein